MKRRTMLQLYRSTDELVNIKTAAKILGCSVSKLYHDHQDGIGITHFVIHSRVRYRVQDLLDHIESCRVVTDDDAGSATEPAQAAANG